MAFHARFWLSNYSLTKKVKLRTVSSPRRLMMAKKINGTSGSDILLGTSDADSISAGAGMDMIYGFLGLDTIDGGAGYDTLLIASTLIDLNRAADIQITGIEEISAKLANGGVRIDLNLQSEGFSLTGSSYNDFLTGGRGADLINSGDGDDTIYGFDPTDTVNGGGGLDVIITTSSIEPANDAQLSGIETINAATATASVTINLGKQSEKFLVIGSNLDDRITGGSAADVINSGAGNDKIFGFAGNDYVNGGTGVDTLIITATSPFLNAAMDYQLVDVEIIIAENATSGVIIDLSKQPEGFAITGSIYSDTLIGGQGSDKFYASTGVDVIDGGAGDDVLFLTRDLGNITNAQLVNIETVSAIEAQNGISINLNAQNERLKVNGSAYADILTGGIGYDVINAGGGDDTINGFVGLDTIDGGAGLDILILTASSASLNTATDNQFNNVEAISAALALTGVNINLASQTEGFQITGSKSSDTLKGGSGDDIIFSTLGIDYIDGGKGFDTLMLKNSNANINGASDAQIENVDAVSAADAITGVSIILNNQTEAFFIIGGKFADILTGTAQPDTFVGFLGSDTINGGAGLDVISIAATSSDLNAATNLQITNIEKVSAVSASGPVKIDLSKQLEAFQILGSAFNDTLTGGLGSDRITGGDGADHFIFNKISSNKTAYTILDFATTVDKLEFAKTAFLGLDPLEQIPEALLWVSSTDTAAHDADDRIIYNTTTGALFYDPDGLNGDAALQIATLSTRPPISYADIIII